MRLLVALVALPLLAQTTANVVYNANTGSAFDYYAAASNPSTRPTLISYAFDGLTSSSKACVTGGRSFCGFFTWITSVLNWNVVSVGVVFPTSGPTNIHPAPVQDAKCLPSFLAAHPGTYGNPMALHVRGTSGGSLLALLVGMSAPGKWLSSDANCSTSNTTGWQVLDVFANSGLSCMSNDTDCLYQAGGAGAQASVVAYLNGAPTSGTPATLAADASVTLGTYMADWGGRFPILLGTANPDGSIPDVTQNLLVSAAATAGYSVQQFFQAGAPHGLDDEGPSANGCGLGQWGAAACLVRSNFTSNCPHSNFEPCGPYGMAWQQYVAFVRPNTSGSSGGSGAAGGSVF